MKSKNIFLILAVSVFLLSGCAGLGKLGLRHLSALRIGMSMEEALSAWKGKRPQEEYAITFDDESRVFIRDYRMTSGSEGATLGHIILAFNENKLLYWGFTYEYLRSDNPELRKIGARVAEKQK